MLAFRSQNAYFILKFLFCCRLIIKLAGSVITSSQLLLKPMLNEVLSFTIGPSN